MTAPIRDMAGLVQALREAQDDRDISHEIVDSLSGLPSGYWSKVAAPVPIKNLGAISLGPVLGALGKMLMLVDDAEQIPKVQGRWVKRKPFGPRRNKTLLASAAGMTENGQETLQIEAKMAIRERMKLLEKLTPKTAKSKGGKRRMKMMGKRARQRMAQHAARKRWSKA